ncbi:hypothetical protein EPO05_06780 [Patescibacteria group bacterium]|nr:MAG: hypothetical protein EPO05_06780 [Patescibacteria group bacterium]
MSQEREKRIYGSSGGNRIFPLNSDVITETFLLKNSRADRDQADKVFEIVNPSVRSYFLDTYHMAISKYTNTQQEAFRCGAAVMHSLFVSNTLEKEQTQLPEISEEAMGLALTLAYFKSFTGLKVASNAYNDIHELLRKNQRLGIELNSYAGYMGQFSSVKTSNAFMQGAIEMYTLFEIEDTLRKNSTLQTVSKVDLADIVPEVKTYNKNFEDDVFAFGDEYDQLVINNPHLFHESLGGEFEGDDIERKRSSDSFFSGVVYAHGLVRTTAERKGKKVPFVPKELTEKVMTSGEEKSGILFPLVESELEIITLEETGNEHFLEGFKLGLFALELSIDAEKELEAIKTNYNSSS